MNKLTFDAHDHAYKLNGVAVLSVTQILNLAGISDVSKIPEHILKKASDFGTKAHTAVELRSAGKLDILSISPRMLKIIEDFDEWRQDFTILENEMRVYSISRNYAGTFDILCENSEGKRGIVDLKTGMQLMHHRLQNGAYASAYEEMRLGKIDFTGELYINGRDKLYYKQHSRREMLKYTKQFNILINNINVVHEYKRR